MTFAHQDDLPKLPIPDLEVTSSRYLDALKPLQSGREHEDTEAAVKDFVRKDGPELQERLRKYATSKSSYIEEFCMCSCNEELYSPSIYGVGRADWLIEEPLPLNRVRRVPKFR